MRDLFICNSIKMNILSSVHELNLTGRVIAFTIFLVPALLLWTPNFSVAVTVVAALYAMNYCVRNRKNIPFGNQEWMVLAVFSIYLITNLPNIFNDLGNFRYIEGPIKILCCFPFYLMFKRELPKIAIRPWLEFGVFFGAIGAFVIACYQFFYLHFPRVDGFLFSINFGYLACSLAGLNLCLTVESKNKLCLLIGFVLATIATILTFSRGAIIPIPLLVFLFLFLHPHAFKKKYIAFSFLVGIVVSGMSYHMSSSVQQRVDYTVLEITHILSGDIDKAVSSGGRLQLWLAATKALEKSPIRGLTYNERETLNAQLTEEGKVTIWVKNVVRGHAHSQYFEMLASNGLPAIATFILLFLVPFCLFFKCREHIYPATGVVFISGIMLFGLTEVLLQANIISIYFGLFLAFFLATCHCLTDKNVT